MKRMLSVRPGYVSSILNGFKKNEVRKDAFSQGDEVYIYCTKGKESDRLIDFDKFAEVEKSNRFHYVDLNISSSRLAFMPYLNGKVVAKFIVGKVEKIELNENIVMTIVNSEKRSSVADICDKACISEYDLLDYSCPSPNLDVVWEDVKVFALEITHLEIFDYPKSLQEFGFKKAPQSWCYVKEGV